MKLYVRYLLALGVILSAFIFDLIGSRFDFIRPVLVTVIFWTGIGILVILILMEVIHWIIEFIKTEGHEHGTKTTHSGNTNESKQG
ncbi:MAG: hypothetical protein WCV90_06940 [Candidatus Woesearchaeota archaeon]|jgi:hypothetical protein